MASKNKNSIAVTGENKDILVVFTNKAARLHDLTNQGRLIQKIDVPDMVFGGVSVTAGRLRLFFLAHQTSRSEMNQIYSMLHLLIICCYFRESIHKKAE